MRGWLTLFFAFLFAATPVLAQTPPSGPVAFNQPVIAITHVALVDGTGAPAARDMTIVIREGRIAELGPSRRIRVPAGATVIDGTGKTVLPGFVFVHEHLFYPSGGGHFASMLGELPAALSRGRGDHGADRRLGRALCRSQPPRCDRRRTGDRPRFRHHRPLYRGRRPRHHGAARRRQCRRGRAAGQLLGRHRRHLVQGLYDAGPRRPPPRDRDRAPPRPQDHRPSLRRHLSRGGGDGDRQSGAWLRAR